MKKLVAVSVMTGIILVTPEAALPSHIGSPTWRARLSISSQDPVSLDVFPGGRGFALQYRSGAPDFTRASRSLLYTSTDFGKTWEEQSPPKGAHEADFASPTTG